VDVDKCRETAVQQGIAAMPTFVFYRNKVRVDQVKVSDISNFNELMEGVDGVGVKAT